MLAAIVAEEPTASADDLTGLRVLSLGTGNKCVGAGAMCCELPLLDPRFRSDTLVADEETELLVLARAEYIALVRPKRWHELQRRMALLKGSPLVRRARALALAPEPARRAAPA